MRVATYMPLDKNRKTKQIRHISVDGGRTWPKINPKKERAVQEFVGLIAGFYVVVQEFNDVFGRGTGEKYLSHALLL